MIRYLITPGTPSTTELLERIAHLAAARAVDWIQIRERRLPAKALHQVTETAVALARPYGVKVLVNERADVALAAGADGVHLPSNAIPLAREYRKLGLFVGSSCHDGAELREAEAFGADFAVLGPVFAPLSKTSEAPPMGLEEFTRLVSTVTLPVLALGGIQWELVDRCMAAGASGIAGVSLYSTKPLPRQPGFAP